MLHVLGKVNWGEVSAVVVGIGILSSAFAVLDGFLFAKAFAEERPTLIQEIADRQAQVIAASVTQALIEHSREPHPTATTANMELRRDFETYAATVTGEIKVVTQRLDTASERASEDRARQAQSLADIKEMQRVILSAVTAAK